MASRIVGTRPAMNVGLRIDRPATGVANLLEIATDKPAPLALVVCADTCPCATRV